MLAQTSGKPIRSLSDQEIEAFWRDGVLCVRQLYSPEWVTLLTKALDDICSKPSPVTNRPRQGTFHSDLYSWLTNDDVRDFVLYGPGASLAQQAFRSKKVNFFYDQIFVKERMSPNPPRIQPRGTTTLHFGRSKAIKSHRCGHRSIR